MAADDMELASLQIKVGSKVELEISPYNPSMTLSELRDMIEEKVFVEKSKQSLIYKGKKLVGMAFPDNL